MPPTLMVGGGSSLAYVASQDDLSLPSSHLDHSLSGRDMSPLTDVDSESHASEEYTEDEGRTSDNDQGEDMIKLSTSKSGSNLTAGNKNTHLSRKSTIADRLICSTGAIGGNPPSCTDMPQKKKVRDRRLYLQEEQCHKLWIKHRERLGYRKQTMSESMSAYKTNVLAPLLKVLLDEPDDVIFSARAMPTEEYEQLLFLGYPWLEDRIHNQLTFPGLWSLRAPVFDTACSKCRRGNIRCEARAIGASINDPAGRKKYYGLSCKYCLASNSRGCDAWMHCWDVPYQLWSSRDKPDGGLECMEEQLAVKEDVSDKLIPEKQASTITTVSPISSTDNRNPPLFLDLRTCTQIWRENHHRLGYRERLVSESLSDYISNVLAPLRDAILIEPDDIVFSARAMSSHAYKRLLLLEYPWLEVTEAKYIKNRVPSLEHWSLKAPVFDDACARCRRDNIRCEAKAIGVPVHDPQGHKKYAGHSLSCKYCAAIQASPCGAWMRCWGDSNPWVAPEHVMKNDLKHERVRMRIKSASEVRTKPVQKQTAQKVRAPRLEMNRQQHTLEETRKKDKERWEKERALVHDRAVARSSMLFAGGALQVGPLQPPSVPSTSSGKERLLNENQGRTEWADRGGVDVQMQEQELSADLTSASMLDVHETLRIGDDCGQEFPTVEEFDPFSPTAHPPNQRLSSDSVFPNRSPPQLICDSRDSPVHSDNIHHSNNPPNDTGSGKRSLETAFGADTIRDRDADAPCLFHSLPTAEPLHAHMDIQQENIEEDFSFHPFHSEEAQESTSRDPIDASLSTLRNLKETFIDVVRQLQVDKANLETELEGFKMNFKRLEESEARYKQENSQLNTDKRKLEESLKQSLLKGAEADERVKLVYRILEETRRDWQIPK